MVIAGWVRAVVSKFSEVQPCAAADRPRSATMPRRFPASASRAVTAFIHISKEPRRRLAQPDNVGQRFFCDGGFGVGSGRSPALFRHPGLDPGSTAAPKSWTPDQVRGDDDQWGSNRSIAVVGAAGRARKSGGEGK